MGWLRNIMISRSLSTQYSLYWIPPDIIFRQGRMAGLSLKIFHLVIRVYIVLEKDMLQIAQI